MMMVSLFSIFDPSTPNFMHSNLTSTLLFIPLAPTFMWACSNRLTKLLTLATSYIRTEFKPIIKKSPFVLIIPLALFVFIACNNSMGLAPYIFTGTSQLILTASLAIPLWMSLTTYGWMNNTSNMLAHLIPQGTPMLIMPFMVMIETISNMIRPFTLAIRLTANMVAGHLLIVLLNSADTSTPSALAPLLLLAKLALLLLELAVAFIQAYVFSVLVTLYASEFTN
nr:TPA_asm: ATP6 [Gammarus fossarum]